MNESAASNDHESFIIIQQWNQYKRILSLLACNGILYQRDKRAWKRSRFVKQN